MDAFWKGFGYIAQPIIEVLLTLLVPLVIVAIVQGFMRLMRYLKVTADQKDTEIERALNTALHQSFERGIRMAMLRYGVTPELLGKMIGDTGGKDSVKTIEKIIGTAIDGYVKPNMSGTIEKLGVTERVLFDIAQTKIVGAAKN